MRILQITLLLCGTIKLSGQQSYTASFVAKLGTDTVIVETYNMLPNHLYGKAFLRYPEDQVGIFDFHFYPDGSIKHYSMSLMRPDSSYVTSAGTQGVYCENDTCTWFASWPGQSTEYVNKRAAKQMDFIGGWTPTLSLIEWNCMRLIRSGKQSLPLTMINDYIGTRHVAISKGTNDTMIFGGDFLEYTKIKVTPDGQITAYDGTGTPWNYIATKHAPIDVDATAKRMSKKPKIGIPSPEVKVDFLIANDTIRLSYGRPSKRGRKIFGGIVPFDSVWRTGAGDPTTLTLPYNIYFGKTLVPNGSYSMYTIPRTSGWTLIFNTDLKQWPTEPDRSKDFALIPLQVKKPAKQTEQFTITIEPSNEGGLLKFIWDETEAYASFRIDKK
ncbi:MAG TPA: DUF2911 domain-containing protein [Flavisolibacter sp.]|nr:DUF2911 domain-containing protein [Flavisolibacter sp.]